MNEFFPWKEIRIRIHGLFWVVILSSVWTGQFMEVTTLFVLVFIHELGHVTAARSFGWRMRSIELLPFGGVAHSDEWGTVSSREEIAVALAGPFHNVLMVLFGYVFFRLGWWSQEWMEYFVRGNALMAGFNLLPIYPLDGGRVLQAILSYRLPYRTTLEWSLAGSLAGGVSLLMYSISGKGWDLNLAIIALFLIYSNVTAFRQRDYQYMRFLIRRREGYVPAHARIVRLPVTREDALLSVLKKLRKEAYHILMVKDRRGQWRPLPEEAVFRHFFDDRKTDGRIGDLIA
ncbi:sporulation factor SpoIVFB [Melghirimyces profundicolus]|uniref:Sporulation factor SpoIVFB n=1 Tax=Melghirimyces profundicolus TaxID=1242148 RepID=A0A2T6BTJ6_9BACL|nr:M50 family metallopeptidase [Melghirimyces profundicolus]PTX59401.1 sporulation factor SpoIVFB [Melghirimyces profundicolus]